MTTVRPLDFDDLDPALQDTLRKRYERLGYLGDFFRYAGHQPAAVAAFEQFTEACKKALGPELAETVALTVATWAGNDYERNQHERLAVRSGLGRSWVKAVEALAPDAPGELSATARLVQRYVLAAVDPAGAAEARLDDVAASLGDATAAAVALLAGRFVAHALVSRSLGLRPAVPSIFEDGFDG